MEIVNVKKVPRKTGFNVIARWLISNSQTQYKKKAITSSFAILQILRFLVKQLISPRKKINVWKKIDFWTFFYTFLYNIAFTYFEFSARWKRNFRAAICVKLITEKINYIYRILKTKYSNFRIFGPKKLGAINLLPAKIQEIVHNVTRNNNGKPQNRTQQHKPNFGKKIKKNRGGGGGGRFICRDSVQYNII